MYKKRDHRTYNSLLISVVAHFLFVIIMGFFIKNTYEPAKPPIAIEWVEAPPIEIKTPKQLPLSLPKPAVAKMKSPSQLPVRSASKSAHEIPQVEVEYVEIVRDSVEIDRDAKISDVLPVIATSAQFQTDVKTRETIDLTTSTPIVVEAPGSGQRTVRTRAAGFGDTQGLSDVDSFGMEQYGVIGKGEGGSGGGVGDGGIGNGFADVGTEAPKIIEIDSKTPGKKDIFGIGKYVDKTREGKKQQVVYVLDVSTSMNRKRKLDLATQALKDSLAMLQKNDRFNIITFDGDVRTYSNKMLSVTRKNLQRAYTYMDTLQTRTGTYLSEALKEALALKTSTIIVISDGKPSRGITDTDKLLAFVKRRNRRHARIMTIALGQQRQFQGVTLLQQLATQNNGEMKLINIR